MPIPESAELNGRSVQKRSWSIWTALSQTRTS